jgi:putative endonuclease
LYTGITNNITRRMAAHKAGKGAKFTRSFGFKELLYTEEYPTKSEASKREKQIQKFGRLKKLALIQSS